MGNGGQPATVVPRWQSVSDGRRQRSKLPTLITNHKNSPAPRGYHVCVLRAVLCWGPRLGNVKAIAICGWGWVCRWEEGEGSRSDDGEDKERAIQKGHCNVSVILTDLAI